MEDQKSRAMIGRAELPDGTKVFYRHMGDPTAPPFLLTHGFPTSSFQFRELMPRLARRFHVVAPDLPGFGFTETPPGYVFTFDNLSRTLEAFLEAIKLPLPTPVYIFDYGAPTSLRLFLRRPDIFSTIITQNGNAYEAGLGPAWEEAGIRNYWKSGTKADRDKLRIHNGFDAIRWQYEMGHPDPQSIAPETYALDTFLAQPAERQEALLDLFGDYKTNVALYPDFARVLREAQPRVLAIWGKHDVFFVPAGAEAFAADVEPSRFRLKLLEAGHFALESHVDEIAREILDFVP